MTEQQRKSLLLEGCRRTLGNCRRCDLHPVRQNLVFGGGDPNAPIMVIASNVTHGEDTSGIILKGDHGGLLGQSLYRVGLDLSRDVYATVAVKCQRPQVIKDGERTRAEVTEEQREACARFVRWQISIVQPVIIVTHGKLAAEVVLGEKRSFGDYLGSWRELGRNCIALATHNPAGLLFGDRRGLIGEFQNHWEGVAERLDCLGREWKPDARCFAAGWTFNKHLGAPA